MAIVAGDWEVTRSTGNIRYIGGDHGASPTYATVIELHRWLQGLADDASSAGDDELDITDLDPSARSTDNIITLKNSYNIDDVAMEHLYDGSIIQNGGDDIYDGIVNFGNSDVQIQLIQDGKVLADDWWNFGGAGLNADSAQGISHRWMLKVRSDGVDIDGRRLLGTTRTFGNTYAEFKINGTSRGNNVLALSDSTDLNNATAQATVATWDQFANDNEGYFGIDVDNDATDEYYYSSWDIGGGTVPASPTINDLYEWTKNISRDGSTTTTYAINGELFRGITHDITYDGEAGTGPVEKKLVVWGTEVAWDTPLATAGTPGEYYDFSISGAKGLLLAIDDNTTTGNAVFAMDGTTAVDNDVVTRSDGTAADGFTVATTVTDPTANGGAGIVLADNTTDHIWIQLLTGVAPVNNLPMHTADVNSASAPIGSGSAYDTANQCLVDTTVTEYTISTPFVGASTGSAIIGSYGLGVDTTDLTQNDKLTALDATVYSPPNIVTFTVGGLVSGEDRVLVAPWDGSSTDTEGNPAIDLDQLTLNTTLNASGQTSIVVTAAIPTDTPATGVVRVELDDGRYRRVAYTSWTGSTFTTASTDWTTPDDATAPKNVYIGYLDQDAAAASHSFQGVYSTDRNFVVIVRDGKATPIKQFISSAQNSSAGGSITAIRTTDT